MDDFGTQDKLYVYTHRYTHRYTMVYVRPIRPRATGLLHHLTSNYVCLPFKDFNGNNDNQTPVTSTFPMPVFTRFIRVYPKAWITWVSLRFEILGCIGKKPYYIHKFVPYLFTCNIPHLLLLPWGPNVGINRHLSWLAWKGTNYDVRDNVHFNFEQFPRFSTLNNSRAFNTGYNVNAFDTHNGSLSCHSNHFKTLHSYHNMSPV